MDRPTVHDLARHAQVSLATVDRVLNDRPGVRKQTIDRVNKAITELGYSRDTNAALLARKKPHRFVFLLPSSKTQFLGSLIDAIKEATSTHASLRANVEVLQASMKTPEDASEAIRSLDAQDLDGLAIMAPETPSVRDAVLKLQERGIKVVPIVSDLPNSGCGHFVGINNVAAGRTAGLLLGGFSKLSEGSIAVIGGHALSRDFVDRRLGFDAVIREQYPHLRVLPTVEGFDDATKVEQLTARLMRTNADLVGIYLAGAGTSGLNAALKKADRPDLKVIAHDMTQAAKDGLKCALLDAVIVQDVGHITRSAIRVLHALKDGLPISAAQERIRIEIFTKENLPDP